MKEKFLSESEVNELIDRARNGSNKAWDMLCKNFSKYIHKCCWKRLKTFDITFSDSKNMEEDLYMAGWQGFVQATKNYNPQKVKFLTYATYYINREISKELNILLNPLGLTGRPRNSRENVEESYFKGISLEELPEIAAVEQETASRFDIHEDAPDRVKYSAEQRVLQILDILKKITDDNHTLSKKELIECLRVYRIAKYDNGTPLESTNTITRALENILLEIDPLEHSKDNDEEYRVKYEGYEEDRLKKKINKEYSGKVPDISGFSYVHTFSDAQLDQLIAQVCFSDMLSTTEKKDLVDKLVGTASLYYRTPFWDGEKIKFNPKAVHGRFSWRRPGERELFAGNVKIIQYAINNLGQIRFRFNKYTDDKKMTPASEYIHTLSPYHLVVYHDNYYCIGLKTDDKRIWHYRVDLMSDIEIVKGENGNIIPIEHSGNMSRGDLKKI
jgi:DNA-directed RNA polymerase specialized sigma subunit